MPLLPGKKNVGRNIKMEMKHGKPHDQAVAIAMKTAKMPMKEGQGHSKMPMKNAPLFPDSTKEGGFDGKAQWNEPLSGPSDRTVGNPPGEMSNLKAFEQNQAGTPDLTPGFPAPIQDSDFGDKGDFSPGTKDNLKDWI